MVVNHDKVWLWAPKWANSIFFHQIRAVYFSILPSFQYQLNLALCFSLLFLKMCVSKWMEPLEPQQAKCIIPQIQNTQTQCWWTLNLWVHHLLIPGQIIGLSLPLCRFQPKQPIRGNTTLSPAFIYGEFHGWRNGINHLHGCFSSISVYKRTLVCISTSWFRRFHWFSSFSLKLLGLLKRNLDHWTGIRKS